jgi:hypothetical protein
VLVVVVIDRRKVKGEACMQVGRKLEMTSFSSTLQTSTKRSADSSRCRIRLQYYSGPWFFRRAAVTKAIV